MNNGDNLIFKQKNGKILTEDTLVKSLKKKLEDEENNKLIKDDNNGESVSK